MVHIASKVQHNIEVRERKNLFNTIGINVTAIGSAAGIWVLANYLEKKAEEPSEPKDKNNITTEDLTVKENNTPEKKAVKTDKEKLEEINNLVKFSNVNLSQKTAAYQKDVIKKYDALIAFYEQAGGVEANKGYISIRLANYIKALDAQNKT